MKSNCYRWLNILLVVMMGVCILSCSKDDDKETNSEKESLKGYWIREDALNAPKGFTGDFGRYFPGNGTVITFHMDSNEKLANKGSYNGHTFYYETPRSSRAVPYIINGKKLIINPTNNPEYCTITGSNSFVGSNGTWKRFK